jgi:lysophospholipase L1-like esterase
MFLQLFHSFYLFLFLGALVHAAPKILIAGDSTAADYSKSSVLQGWGTYLGDYTAIKVVNKAKNGRSTRSFIAEGLWSQLLAMTSPGDFIVIEMGHNDVSMKENAVECDADVVRSKMTLETQT